MKIETIEAIATAGSRTTVGGATIGAIGAFISSNMVGVGGLFIALLGVIVNVHFRRKADKRMQVEHDLRMKERMLRIDLMRATGRPLLTPEGDTDLGKLETIDG